MGQMLNSASGGMSIDQRLEDIEEQHYSNINVNLDYTDAISEVGEYFRASICGNICIVDIGGIVLNDVGDAQVITSDIPTPKTRPLGILSTDPVNVGEAGHTTLCYGTIGDKNLKVHVPNGIDGVKLYGQIVFLI